MDEITKILKALADENRLKIVKILESHDLCVRGLSNKLGISEAAVSQHLKILRNVDIVVGEKRGYYTHYHVKKETLKCVSEYFDEFVKKEN